MTDRQQYSLNWKQTYNTFALSRWEAGDYRLDGIGREYGGGVRRVWTLYYRDTVISEPSRLSEGKRDADVHRGVSPSAPRSIAAPSVDDSPAAAPAAAPPVVEQQTAGEKYAAIRRRAQEALTPAAPLVRCTHGEGCPVHPEQARLHDFTPGAVEALRAVLIQVRYLPITEVTLRQIVASLGLDFADVERGL